MRMPRSVSKTTATVAALAVAAALAIVLAVVGWPGGDDSDPARDGPGSTSAGPSEPPPLDGRPPCSLGSADPPPAPRTVPAVRSYELEGGPGWRPGEDSRVVVDRKGPLADEADRLARELGLTVAEGPPRRGDIALALHPASVVRATPKAGDGKGTRRPGDEVARRPAREVAGEPGSPGDDQIARESYSY